MPAQRVNFDSAEVVEAGREAAESMLVICNSTRHGYIKLEIADGVVLQCDTLIRKRPSRHKSGASDPKTREPAK